MPIFRTNNIVSTPNYSGLIIPGHTVSENPNRNYLCNTCCQDGPKCILPSYVDVTISGWSICSSYTPGTGCPSSLPSVSERVTLSFSGSSGSGTVDLGGNWTLQVDVDSCGILPPVKTFPAKTYESQCGVRISICVYYSNYPYCTAYAFHGQTCNTNSGEDEDCDSRYIQILKNQHFASSGSYDDCGRNSNCDYGGSSGVCGFYYTGGTPIGYYGMAYGGTATVIMGPYVPFMPEDPIGFDLSGITACTGTGLTPPTFDNFLMYEQSDTYSSYPINERYKVYRNRRHNIAACLVLRADDSGWYGSEIDVWDWVNNRQWFYYRDIGDSSIPESFTHGESVPNVLLSSDCGNSGRGIDPYWGRPARGYGGNASFTFYEKDTFEIWVDTCTYEGSLYSVICDSAEYKAQFSFELDASSSINVDTAEIVATIVGNGTTYTETIYPNSSGLATITSNVCFPIGTEVTAYVENVIHRDAFYQPANNLCSSATGTIAVPS